MASGSHQDATRDGSQASHLSPGPRLIRFLFRDRVGLALFLATLTVLGILLRLDSLINDSYTVINTLINLGNGDLELVTRPIGPQPSPGLHEVDGRIYGRNYGQAALALPAYLFLRIVDPVVSTRVLLLGSWTAVAAGFVTLLSGLTDHRWLRHGGYLVIGGLLGCTLLLNPLWGKGDPATVALLLSSIVSGAATVVLVYRIGARRVGDRVGLALGVATLVATPVPLWAIIAKRHAVVAALLMTAVFCFLASRSGSTATPRQFLATRAGAYGAVGFLAWIHAPVAATVLPVLLVADLATAPRNDPKTLAVLGAVLVLAALPTFVTNTLVTGNPIYPPRFWPTYEPAATAAAGVVETTPGGIGESGTSVAGSTLDTLNRFVSRHVDGLEILLTKPEQVSRTFIWHGVIPDGVFTPPIRPGSNLSVASSMPLLGLLGAAVGRLVRRRGDVGSVLRDVDATTWFAAGLILGYVLLFLPSLPVFTQITVRYLHPIYPLALVLLTGSAVVRELCRDHHRRVWRVGMLTFLVVAAAHLLLLVTLGLHTGEIFQVHAAVNLGAWTALAVLATLAGFRNEVPRGLPTVTGFAAGVTAAFLANLTLVYFHHGQSLVPVIEAVTRWFWMLAYF